MILWMKNGERSKMERIIIEENKHGFEIERMINKAGVNPADVVLTIMINGFKDVSSMDDSDIEEIEGNGLWTTRYTQMVLKTAKEVCYENYQDIFAEFIPYIINCLKIYEARTEKIRVYKNEVTGAFWDKLMRTYDLDCLEDDEDEPEYIDLNANLLEAGYWKEDYKED